MSNVTLRFGGKKKRALIPDSFEDLEAIVRKKFPDIPEGKIEIKATVADGNTYDIENDMDLEDLGRDGIVALSIQSQSPKFTGTVVISETRYQVDEIPKTGSPIVQQMLEEINQKFNLKQKLAELCQGIDLLQLTAIAANKPGAGLQFLEKGAYDLIVFMTELSHDADVFYTKCDTCCGSVTSSVMTAVAFFSDGFDGEGIQTLASLGGISRLMGENCQKLMTKIEAGVGKMSHIETILGEAVKSYEERERLPTDIEKLDVTTASLTKDLHDLEVGATQRRERSDQVAGSMKMATVGAAASTAAVASLLATGIQSGTLAMTLPVVGLPLALLVATSGLLIGLNRQVSDTYVKQKEDEQELASKRREEVEAKSKRLDLTQKLKELSAVNVEHALECLHLIKGDLKLLRSTLVELKQFWETMSAMFFQSQQDKKEAFESKTAKHLEGYSSNQIFKAEVINYLARWVAFREHCIESQVAIKANIKPLYRLMRRNPTRAEAEEELHNTARQISTDLAICP